MFEKTQKIKETQKKQNRGIDGQFFIETIKKTNRVIRKETSVNKMVDGVLGVILEAFKCDRVWTTYPADPNAETWSSPVSRWVPEYPGLPATMNIPMTPEASRIIKMNLESDEPVALDPASGIKLEAEAVKAGVQSALMMAIYPKLDKPWIFGIHQCSYARVWTDREKELFGEIGYLAAGALDNLLLLKDLKETQSGLEAKVAELEKANNLMVGRELRMVELKEELEKMRNKESEEGEK